MSMTLLIDATHLMLNQLFFASLWRPRWEEQQSLYMKHDQIDKYRALARFCHDW